MFSRVVLHGRRFGPPGAPSAFKTQFGWVLTGTVGHANHRKSCHFRVTGEGPRDNRSNSATRPHSRNLKAVPALAGGLLAPEPHRNGRR